MAVFLLTCCVWCPTKHAAYAHFAISIAVLGMQKQLAKRPYEKVAPKIMPYILNGYDNVGMAGPIGQYNH